MTNYQASESNTLDFNSEQH